MITGFIFGHVTPDYNISISYLSTKYTTLHHKRKDWLWLGSRIVCPFRSQEHLLHMKCCFSFSELALKIYQHVGIKQLSSSN